MKYWKNGKLHEAADPSAEMQKQWEADARRAKLEESSRPLTFEEVQKITLRKQVNSLGIDDATASRMVDYYPEMTDFAPSSLIAAQTVTNWHGTLKRAAVDLWNTTENNPDNAPTLWQDIAYKQGIRIIPSTITATEYFAKGEQGWWNESIYESLIDANVYTPDQYPAGWELIS